MTVLAVEHDMAFVRQIAQRVTVLHFGRIFAQGTIEEIVANDARGGDLSGARAMRDGDRCSRPSGLRSGYGGKPVLQGVELTVERGRDRRRDRPQRRRQVDADAHA